jgi:hypothetical protein
VASPQHTWFGRLGEGSENDLQVGPTGRRLPRKSVEASCKAVESLSVPCHSLGDRTQVVAVLFLEYLETGQSPLEPFQAPTMLFVGPADHLVVPRDTLSVRLYTLGVQLNQGLQLLELLLGHRFSGGRRIANAIYRSTPTWDMSGWDGEWVELLAPTASLLDVGQSLI